MIQEGADTSQSGGSAPPVWQSSQFADLMATFPRLRAMESLLAPASAHTRDDLRRVANLESSYQRNDFGRLFYALVRALRPLSCVELGVRSGYSLLHAALGLRDNGEGHISGYDLFEDYPYRHEARSTVLERIKSLHLEDWASVYKSDAMEVHNGWDSVDYLHVDLSNTGETFLSIFANWGHRVRGVMLLEGGSRERDAVGWMVEYRKPPIVPALDVVRAAYPEWELHVVDVFPSVTVAMRSQLLQP